MNDFFFGFFGFFRVKWFQFLAGKNGKMRDFSVVLLGYVGQEFCFKLSWKFLALFRGLSCICKNGEKGGFFGWFLGLELKGVLMLLQRGEGKNLGVGMKGNCDVNVMGIRVAKTLGSAKAWGIFFGVVLPRVYWFFSIMNSKTLVEPIGMIPWQIVQHCLPWGGPIFWLGG